MRNFYALIFPLLFFITTIVEIYYTPEQLMAQGQYFSDATQDQLPAVIDVTFDADFGDIDGDNDLDIIVTNAFPTDDPNYLYINNGLGYFLEETEDRITLQYDNTTDSELGDVDGDRDLDLIFVNFNYDPETFGYLFINQGTGFFADETSLRLPSRLCSSCTGTDFGDVDGDLDLDLVISNYGFNRLLLNVSWQRYDVAPEEVFPMGTEDSNDVVFTDVDGDFDLDVFIVNNTGVKNRILMNNGNGYFIDETEERIPIDTGQSNGQSILDIDGDGDLDIFVANGFLPGLNRLWINDGSGYFTDESEKRMPLYGEVSSDASYGDIDNDGDFDLIIANFASQGPGIGTRVFVNNGTGHFTDETDKRYPIIEESTNDVAIGDVDNDGDVDLYIANFGEYPLQEQNRLLINYSTPDSFPPSIVRTFHQPDTGDTTNDYLITSTVWDNIAVARGELSVSLFYQAYSNSLNSNSFNFVEIPMLWSGGNQYRQNIPSQSSGTIVEYYIKAEDKMGNVSYDPPNAPDSVFSFLVDSSVGINEPPNISLPKTFSLSQNYPNPFNPSTTIDYSIPDGNYNLVSLKIYDLRGRLIRTLVEETKGQGEYKTHWDGKNDLGKQVSSGVYLYRLEAENFLSMRKMVLLE
jgi:hypothetical protein